MISSVQGELRSKEAQDIIGQYLQKTDYPKKWIVLTDYCLDAQDKSNVITFVLLHYNNEKEHIELEQKIIKLQKSDIKHTRYISNRLMRYLRKLPVFSFSFILDKRDKLFGDTPAEQQNAVTDNLIVVRDCFQMWLKTALNTDIASYYQKSIKDLDKHIKLVSNGKKINAYEDILLTACIGALYTAEILKDIHGLEVVGWLPDRDKITQSCDEIVILIFHCMLYNCLGGKDIVFPVADPKIKSTPFYDALNRIPDDICAAIADYDFAHPDISKEKFCHVLHELMAGNPFVRVHKLFKDDKGFHLINLYYETTLWMSIKFYSQTAVREVIGFVKMVKNIWKNQRSKNDNGNSI